MVDRVTEIREALDYMDWIAEVAADWPSIEEKVGILAQAARAYADLLDSGAVIIQRDENGEWPQDIKAAGALGLFRLDTYGYDIEFGQQVVAVLSTIEEHLAAVVPVEADE